MTLNERESAAQNPAMSALALALESERTALKTQNVELLMRATEAKLEAVRTLERHPPAVSAASELARLAELNRANGAMLARRRRLIQWSLRALGRSNSASDYNSSGIASQRSVSRPLAIY